MADLMRRHQDGPPERRRLPSVRLAPRDELASMARVAPLLRAARDLGRWAERRYGPAAAASGELSASSVAEAASALDLTPREVRAAWRVMTAAARLAGRLGHGAALAGVLAHGETEAILRIWDAALAVVLDSEELDGIATALYTVGGPVGMDGLFDAYASAAGSRREAGQAEPAPPPVQLAPSWPAARGPAHGPAGVAPGARAGTDQGAALSLALETLADLGVVELGTEEGDASLTVALSPLGTWGVHRRLRAQGWHVPVLGAARREGALALLAALANCDAEDGEAEINAWLAARDAATAAAELIDAAAGGTPGQRGAAFAVLDRIGMPAIDQVRNALGSPLLRAHAAVWLIEHGEHVPLDPADRTWLLVDLGAGLLEEASAQDVVAELLPDLPPEDQADIVARLWEVSHPGVTGFLTALSDHHPVPAVARAARKAAFKARSPAASAD
ncbi:MAG TPA: hypothetical protein VFW16_14335 [Streptosporangiaceae bacterium]|nr:hypothetical protein [Streptosporangiaceae bacterium]